jgi:hypothetical protein
MHSSPFVVLGISVTVCTQNGHCLGSCVSRGISGVPNVWQLMHGEDRVLLVQSDDDDELKIHYLIVPVISNQFASFYVCVLFLSFLFEGILSPEVGPRASVSSLLIKAFLLPDLSSTIYDFYPKLASNSIARYFTELM